LEMDPKMSETLKYTKRGTMKYDMIGDPQNFFKLDFSAPDANKLCGITEYNLSDENGKKIEKSDLIIIGEKLHKDL